MNKYLESYKKIENVAIEKIKKVVNDNKKVFLITVLMGIIIHLFALTNKLIHPDELAFLFTKGNSLILGRWLLDITSYVFPNFSMPTFNGIMALILLALSSCLISNILEIKHDFNKILVGLILMTFPTITCTLTYMFTVHSYMLSLLMAVLAVYFGKKDKKVFWCLSIILLTLSLGIYQAYISVTATLFIFVLIKDTFRESDNKKIIWKALRFLCILLASLMMYAVVNKIVIQVSGVQLADYQGVSSMGHYTITGILHGIIEAYKHIFSPFFGKNVITPMNKLRVIYVICFWLSIIFVASRIWKNKKNKLNSLFSVIFIVLLPIAMNMMYILNEEVKVYAVMLLGDSFIFISLILLLDAYKGIEYYFDRIAKLLLIAQIFLFTILANENYLQMHISYQNAYAFYQGILSQVMQTEGFTPETKIVIAGDYYSNELTKTEQFSSLLPIGEFSPNFMLVNAYSKLNFIRYYIGFNGNLTLEVKEELKNSEEFKNMPLYPYYGSVKKIDDTIVIKLSE